MHPYAHMWHVHCQTLDLRPSRQSRAASLRAICETDWQEWRAREPVSLPVWQMVVVADSTSACEQMRASFSSKPQGRGLTAHYFFTFE